MLSKRNAGEEERIECDSEQQDHMGGRKGVRGFGTSGTGAIQILQWGSAGAELYTLRALLPGTCSRSHRTDRRGRAHRADRSYGLCGRDRPHRTGRLLHPGGSHRAHGGTRTYRAHRSRGRDRSHRSGRFLHPGGSYRPHRGARTDRAYGPHRSHRPCRSRGHSRSYGSYRPPGASGSHRSHRGGGRGAGRLFCILL